MISKYKVPNVRIYPFLNTKKMLSHMPWLKLGKSGISSWFMNLIHKVDFSSPSKFKFPKIFLASGTLKYIFLKTATFISEIIAKMKTSPEDENYSLGVLCFFFLFLFGCGGWLCNQWCTVHFFFEKEYSTSREMWGENYVKQFSDKGAKNYFC